ncbi:MAG TPA: C4-type zinc ribbon domain-containing protein [Blastocatellia bacterium]|nr:C4-type zinc ribbon domain-containing protein [Blastocatellia bacterium]
MRTHLGKLLELQELDLEIQRVAERLGNIPAEREQVETRFKEYAAEFLDLKERYQQTLANRKQIETELADTQQIHEKYKQDLMRVRNEKEYTTALREIDATKKLIGVLETEVLKSLEEAEKLEAELNVFTPDVERKRLEVDRDLESLQKEHESAESRLQSITNQRNETAGSIPGNLLAVYERVAKIRRGQAMAEVRDSTCTACRMRVRPKVFSDVRRGDQLITCDSCSRILFYRPDATHPAEAAMGH